MKAMILAAGLGTRLKPYSEHTPKPLFTINQQPVLDTTIEALCRAGFKSVIVNTHHHHRQIEAFVTGRAYPIPVHLSHEPQILGTGGAIANVADLWKDGPLLVINGDVVSDLDFSRLWTDHQQYNCAVTMVMHHHADFNSVRVDDQNFVTGFDKPLKSAPPGRRLAFTGIHIMERSVLDYLPAEGPAHIIDAYEQMIKAGEKIKAHVVHGHYWQDIGTPERYQTAVYDAMAPAAFKSAFGASTGYTIHRHHLAGDGSDRQWYRLESGTKRLIMVDHGISAQPGVQQEANAYVDIGRHLHRHKVAVPQIFLSDPFAGLVFLEDLGDRNLQQAVQNQTPPKTVALYKRVIDAWLHMGTTALQDFNISWTHQSACYDKATILKNECRYFVEAFLQGYLGWTTSYASLAPDFEQLAEGTLKNGINGLVHRDLQSRNIMVQGDRISFIDFQGARPGPLQYDLASLLIDPYTALDRELQSQLLTYGAAAFERRSGIHSDTFMRGYGYCVLTRNLQILGAFAFLSRVKKKAHFEAYIPRALRHLQHHLSEFDAIEMPCLKRIVAKAAGTIL